jgi:putative ABC transport system ATP-binding protein
VIELSQITKRFNVGKPHEFTAVNEVSLRIESERLTVLKGPSGSGKTTLMTMIGCMARPTSGRIFLHAPATVGTIAGPGTTTMEISSLTERFLTEIRRNCFGFIFQQFNLIRGISVLENIMLPAYPTGEDLHVFRKRAMGLMEQFGLSRHVSSPVEWLSGGELQRVAIARALINNPAIIIADEPTAHLDSRLSREFMTILGELKQGGKTVVIASHDPIVYDSPLVDAVAEMRDGAVTGYESRQ